MLFERSIVLHRAGNVPSSILCGFRSRSAAAARSARAARQRRPTELQRTSKLPNGTVQRTDTFPQKPLPLPARASRELCREVSRGLHLPRVYISPSQMCTHRSLFGALSSLHLLCEPRSLCWESRPRGDRFVRSWSLFRIERAQKSKRRPERPFPRTDGPSGASFQSHSRKSRFRNLRFGHTIETSNAAKMRGGPDPNDSSDLDFVISS